MIETVFMERRRVAVLSAVLVSAMALFAGPVASPAAGAVTDEDISWGVRTADTEQGEGRANFNYSVEPGETITDAVIVTNQGAQDLAIDISTADGYTAADATLAFDGPEVVPVSVGSWITPAEAEVTLRPGESREVEFTVEVPEDASPGDHAGGIFTVSSTVDGSNIQINRRLGLRVHVRVAGEQVVDLEVSELTYQHSASLNPFASGTALVSYTVRNNGTVRTYFTEDLTVTTLGGSSSTTHSTVVDEILPGSEITRTVEVGAWPLLRSTVEVRVLPAAIDGSVGVETMRMADDWVIPWSILVLIVIVLAVTVVIGVRRAGRASATTGVAGDAPGSDQADVPGGPDFTVEKPSDDPRATNPEEGS